MTTGARQPVDVAGLLGTWTVTGTASDPAVLVLRPRVFEVRTGGLRSGEWRAAPDGTFLAHVTGNPASRPADLTPDWLAAATTVAADGTSRILRNAAGAVTARLALQAPPPEISEGDRRLLRPAAPLPAGLTPADGVTLPGRWEPRAGTRAPHRPHVAFAAGDTWTGSDGCNGAAGRWAAGSDGVLLATLGPMTLRGCRDMVGVPGWVGAAARAGLDAGSLVLFDADGRELGLLDRARVA